MTWVWSVIYMTVYALTFTIRCLAGIVSLVTCSSLLAVAYAVDACVDLFITVCPISWIGAMVDRRRVLCLVGFVVATIAWAIQLIAGPSAGCVCVRPRVCLPGGPACDLEGLTALQLFGVGTDLVLVGLRVLCHLTCRVLIRLAQIGPWDVVCVGFFLIVSRVCSQ